MNFRAQDNTPPVSPDGAADWTSLVRFADGEALETLEVVALTAGASVRVERGADADRLTIRGRSGEVELRITLGASGPVLSFTSADLEIAAAGRVVIAGDAVELRSRGDVELSAGGDMNVAVEGRRHSRIAGRDLTEAEAIESQANEGDIVLRAREDVRVDGEHIGLNDDRCPGPLGWTRPAQKGGA